LPRPAGVTAARNWLCGANTPWLEGVNSANLCNRGRRGHGLQLEIERPMRNSLAADAHLLARYTESIRNALRSLQLI
jgi:phage replication-related protein YjqB (UPF0714/DUF867 family)